MAARSAVSVFLVFLRLGLTSFGGPVAHLGYFRETFVVRRAWLDDIRYGEIVALCQILPGPTSSQVGMMIGLSQAGVPGALAAGLGFTLPSAIIMTGCAYGIGIAGIGGDTRWLEGLGIVTVAVVAQAVLGMASMLCRDVATAAIALLGAGAALILPSAGGQDIVMMAGGLAGYALYRNREAGSGASADVFPISRSTSLAALGLFALLLIGLPLLAGATHSPMLNLIASFYRAGALVFGGGHVVLPLLAAATVGHGAVTETDFFAGYALAQAVPGPLFTVAAYLGTLMTGGAPRALAGIVALIAIFTPSLLLILGAAPFWLRWGRRAGIRAALTGVNAAVVGLLLAALYTPLATSAIRNMTDAALAVSAFLLLTRLKIPAWALVAVALGGAPLLRLGG